MSTCPYDDIVRVVPGKPMVMTPPHAQLHMDGDVSAGMFPISVFTAPGFHGPAGTGTHGIGVSTPSAADVAAATVGFARLVHMPNGGMFIIGTMSLIVAAGLPSMSTRLVGSTFNVDGATPKLHVNIAVAVTFGGMESLLPRVLHRHSELLTGRRHDAHDLAVLAFVPATR
ncbi:MAG: hypothetical protein QOD92_1400 [Acidimicrobiaceae bacterium]